MSDIIEREIFIAADIQRVWELIAHAGFWVGDELTFVHPAVVGETVNFVLEQYDDGHYPVRTEKLTPPTYAAYSWGGGMRNMTLKPGSQTLVEFFLKEQDGGTLLSVRESGWDSLNVSDEKRAENYDSNSEGWEMQLELTRIAAETPAA